jgi:putative membrane protein
MFYCVMPIPETEGSPMFDFATKDLSLAIVHHLLIFLLAGVLAFEIGIIRYKHEREDILRVASVDNWYGILAVAIVVVGFSRAIFAAKGWAYHETNGFFWAKIAAFVAVALLSIIPTIQIIRWRRALTADSAFLPAASDIAGVRRFLWAQAVVFALIPAFAAAMARGYGAFAH